MFRHLRLKRTVEPVAPQSIGLSALELLDDPTLPISIKALNRLDEPIKRRLYRTLLPAGLLKQFDIDFMSWKGPGGDQPVTLEARPESEVVRLEVRHTSQAEDPFLFIELADNRFNGINLNFLVISDPAGTRFDTDKDEQGRPTLFGTVHRNRPAEEAAMSSGLAPGQIRPGIAASRAVLQNLEIFLIGLGHRAFYLEPLSYVSAWLFEKRGLAYVSGHKLMDQIHQEFQVDGRLYQALDGQTPFTRPEQANTVRGRAWAIHDGILAAIDQSWNGLRMVKQLNRHAGVNTFPTALY